MVKFTETVSKYGKPELKALLHHLAFHRILCELVLADVICVCERTGEAILKEETRKDMEATLEGERILINLLSRKEAAKVYGDMAGVSSDMETVNYIMEKVKKPLS